MNGQERLIATLIEGDPIWDLAGPQGRAIQRDDEGREVTLLMASKEDAEAIKHDAYVEDEPRAKDFEDTVDLLDELAEEEGWVDAGARLTDGDYSSWRVPARELLDDLLEAVGRSGKDMGGNPQAEDVDRVHGMDSDERYDWFLEWVAIDEAAWALGNEESFMTFPYDDGTSALVLWPHAAFARRWADENDAKELKTYRLPWPKLLKELEIAKDAGEHIAVFPGPDEHSTVLDPEDLRTDLEEARSREEAEQTDP